MAELLERIEKSGIDRRQFVGLAAAVGAVSALGLTGCDNKVTDTSKPVGDLLEGGEWKTFRCLKDGCTNNCVNQAYVVDGVILRQRTDQLVEDSVDNPQFRSCVKGHSQRWDVTAPDRLKYPIKRKNWMPGGGANTNGELRGVDEWERISWDDAIAYIVEEFKRISDTYGPKAFLGLGNNVRYMNMKMCGSKIFNLMGGCLTTYGEMTQGGTMVPMAFLGGAGPTLDRMALRHTKLMVLFGNNTAWIQPMQMYGFLNDKKASGMKIIMIDPWFNPTAQAVADQWIPIRPSTDGALIEALAHELIVNNWVDQDFLDRCCLGFDAEHMPDNAKTNENYKDYILGVYDGQPKTPEWASPITGIPVETIKNLAKDMGTTDPINIRSAFATARTYYGNRLSQQIAVLAWLKGCMGKLGAGYSFGSHGAYGGSEVSRGDSLYADKFPKNPICTESTAEGRLIGGDFDPSLEYGICYAEVHRAVATGEYTFPGPAQEKRQCDIKCIYQETARNYGNQQSGLEWAPQAYRKVDFVLMQDLGLKGSAIYADIVLPVKSLMEMDFANTSEGSAGLNIVGSAVLPTYYEAKDDIEIYFLMCDAMGFGEDVAPRTTQKQCMFERLANTTLAVPGSDRENLVSITQEDLDFYGVTGETQEGRIPIQEYFGEHNGIYRYQREPDDALVSIPNEAFVKDPEANPLKTATGKLEINCQAMKDYYDLCQFHDIDALPKYKPMVDGYESIATNPDPEYKYQMIDVHHLRSVGTVGASNKTLVEVFANDLLMSSYDAQREGFNSGDWALISGKDAGKIARRINAVPYVSPGTVIIGEGNHINVDDATGIDIGGNVNSLIRYQLLGDGYQAYNTVLLKIEKYTGDTLLPDYKRPYVVPVAD